MVVSHQGFLTNGDRETHFDMLESYDDSIRRITYGLRAEFQTRAYLRREFPMIAEWGVSDYGLAVHSLGLNYLSGFGRESGFWAVTEFPINSLRDNASLQQDIRPDVIWFDRPKGEITLLGEFERADSPVKNDAIREKAENLVIAHHQLPPRPRVLLLGLWTSRGIPPTSARRLQSHVRSGFQDARGNRIPALPCTASLIVVTFMFGKTESGLVLREVLA